MSTAQSVTDPVPREYLPTEKGPSHVVDDDERCENCRFYQDKEEGMGRCRRYPPTLELELHGTSKGPVQPVPFVGPPVSASGWCGEWKKAEDGT